jgi:hypothetical protein
MGGRNGYPSEEASISTMVEILPLQVVRNLILFTLYQEEVR